MARKIKNHLDAMERRMGAMLDMERLEDVPLETIQGIFETELAGYWREIESVLTDMLPGLKEE